jgi:hypothetical protein
LTLHRCAREPVRSGAHDDHSYRQHASSSHRSDRNAILYAGKITVLCHQKNPYKTESSFQEI